jgi:hypothetical protein
MAGNNTQEYWRSVRKIAAGLDPEAAIRDQQEDDADMRTHLNMSQKEIWLVSVDNERTGGVAGRVIAAHPMVAARWLKDSTHARASDEQVAAYKAELAGRKEQIEKDEADRKGVPTSKLLEALVAGMAQQPANAQRVVRPKE